jgi:hypothetical protein
MKKSNYIYGTMDPECIAICDAINSLPGCKTNSSCSGHANKSMEIIFTCTNKRSMSILMLAAEIIDNPRGKSNEWTCNVWVSAGYTETPVIGGFSGYKPEICYSLVSSSKGPAAYSAADKVAKFIWNYTKINDTDNNVFCDLINENRFPGMFQNSQQVKELQSQLFELTAESNAILKGKLQ